MYTLALYLVREYLYCSCHGDDGKKLYFLPQKRLLSLQCVFVPPGCTFIYNICVQKAVFSWDQNLSSPLSVRDQPELE